MAYKLTQNDLDHYAFKRQLLRFIAAVRSRHNEPIDITITIDITQPAGGAYALSYTDKGEYHHEP